jgi:transposase
VSRFPQPPRPKTLEEALALNDFLLAYIRKLEARIEDLERRLGQNSQNSSRPPSTDPPDLKLAPKRPPSGRKPGGQPGHEGHQRVLLPPEKVTSSKDHWATECEDCRQRMPTGAAREDVGEPHRLQTVELPEIQPKVHEDRYHGQACPCCAHVTWAKPAAGETPPAFGPRLVSTLALLSGAYRLSKRAIQAVFRELFHIEISLGAISACEDAASEAVAAPVEEARQYVRQQPVLNADETSWKQRAQLVWLWVAVTAWVTVFWILPRRNRVSAHEVLGAFCGTLGTDRYVAYDDYPVEQRQFCWAHLDREFEAMRQRGGAAGPLGKAFLSQSGQMFQWWHKVRKGRMSRATFQRRMGPLQTAVQALVVRGLRSPDAKTAALCADMYLRWQALWTFVHVEGLEPTNNSAERAVRHAVLWRRSSFGTWSERGSRFVERMLTVAATLRQQRREVLDFLTRAVSAHRQGTASPSLLPDRSVLALAAQAA